MFFREPSQKSQLLLQHGHGGAQLSSLSEEPFAGAAAWERLERLEAKAKDLRTQWPVIVWSPGTFSLPDTNKPDSGRLKVGVPSPNVGVI